MLDYELKDFHHYSKNTRETRCKVAVNMTDSISLIERACTSKSRVEHSHRQTCKFLKKKTIKNRQNVICFCSDQTSTEGIHFGFVSNCRNAKYYRLLLNGPKFVIKIVLKRKPESIVFTLGTIW